MVTLVEAGGRCQLSIKDNNMQSRYICHQSPPILQTLLFHSQKKLMADDESNGLVLKLIICLIAAASAAVVVVTLYHCITARHMRRRLLPPPEVLGRRQQETSFSLESSVAELLPARKYRKSSVGVEEGTCAICLCEFEEEEELRTLPDCSHSFHVACIDMWLYSHWSCPMCRSSVGVLGSSLPTLMHLLHPTSLHNTSPIENL